jgi:hypothetical protein
MKNLQLTDLLFAAFHYCKQLPVRISVLELEYLVYLYNVYDSGSQALLLNIQLVGGAGGGGGGGGGGETIHHKMRLGPCPFQYLLCYRRECESAVTKCKHSVNIDS